MKVVQSYGNMCDAVTEDLFIHKLEEMRGNHGLDIKFDGRILNVMLFPKLSKMIY